MRTLVVLALALLAGACSGAKHQTTTAASIGTASTVAGPGPDACGLVTKSDVVAALPGLDIVAGQPARQPGGGDCLYLVRNTSRTIHVKVFSPDGVARFDRLRTVLPDTSVISGIGDRALAQRGGSTVAAVKGATLVEVVAENDDSDQLKTAVRHLLEVAVSRLP